MDNLDALIEMLIQEKGGTKKQYLSLMNKIAHHESKGNPTIKQMGGGPGRGLFQFEEGQHAGGKTAARRTIRYFKENNIPIPKWLKETQLSDSVDASKLTPQQQQILFLGNMRGHPTADFSKVWNNEESVEDFWAKYHWAGLPKDEYDRRQSFKESLDNYQEETISKAFRPKPLKESLVNTKQIDNSRVNLPNYKYNTLNIPQSNTFDKLQEVDNPLTNQFNLGGYLNNLTSQKEFNSFNEGGLHETNPYGGIPQGMGNNGKINTVEEDETSYTFKDKGKYIFSNRIKLDGSGFEQGTQGFANGGNMDCGGPGQPPCSKTKITPEEFTINYINSNKYKERLKTSGYKNIDEEVKHRSDNIKKVNKFIQEKPPGLFDQLLNKITGTPYSLKGSIYNPLSNNMIIDKSQAIDLDTDINSIIAHEYGHAELDNMDISEYDQNYKNRLNKYDINNLSKRLKKTTKDEHSLIPDENKSDLNAFRYQLLNEGYDAGKQDFNNSLLKKSKNTFVKKRLLKNYSEKDLIWLMNNIAYSDKKLNKNTRLS